MNHIIIDVCGVTAGGKSTIGTLIHTALLNEGFDVALHLDECGEPEPDIDRTILWAKLDALKAKQTTFTIRQIQRHKCNSEGA